MIYQKFLADKKATVKSTGFDFTAEKLNRKLFPFQRAIISWALKRGRAGIFLDTGLGKTAIQLEWSNRVYKKTGENILIFAPLCVSQQTVKEGKKFEIDVKYCRNQGECVDGISITNYENFDNFDMGAWKGIVLDESSIIKHVASKTRTKIIENCSKIPYKLSCTATPSPNDYMELGNQSEFLGIMSATEMLATYFTHDGGQTSKWRLKGHAQDIFWRWVATWAVCIQTPADLGYSNDGYILPELRVKKITVESDICRDGELFPVPAQSLQERQAAKRETITERVQAVNKIINTSGDQYIIWCHLNNESDELVKIIPDSDDVRGADKLEEKEKKLIAFANGELKNLITKPSIAGHGLNWQHCHNVIFVGLNDSWEQYYQAVRRCWRYGQKKQVNVWIVSSSLEGEVLRNIEEKEKKHIEMMRGIVKIMEAEMKKNISGATLETMDYKTAHFETDNSKLLLGDSVEEIKKVGTETIDYTIFSPPFSSLYTYTNSARDLGNCKNHKEFFDHFRFLSSELFRVTAPGRLLSFHCMLLPLSKQSHGVIGLYDFRGDLIRLFQDAGFVFHSEVVIWKDPVIAMQRTKALGLLYKQLKKDSCRCRQGIPDYLITMRKDGDNHNPVEHTPTDFPCERWQQYASPVWADINPSKTLQFREARGNKDERHICPLQLQVIDRALELWTREGDLVLSPFAGIGSEGHCAIKAGRKFLGIELKKTYYNVACKNLTQAENEKITLF